MESSMHCKMAFLQAPELKIKKPQIYGLGLNHLRDGVQINIPWDFHYGNPGSREKKGRAPKQAQPRLSSEGDLVPAGYIFTHQKVLRK